jgi:hypothetical protein
LEVKCLLINSHEPQRTLLPLKITGTELFPREGMEKKESENGMMDNLKGDGMPGK